MRSPPATSIVVGPSYVYRGTVVVLTCFVIALYSTAVAMQPLLGWGFLLLAVLAACIAIWACYDAFKHRQGALHFANHEWVYADGDVESQGTLQVVVDLNFYILAIFKLSPEFFSLPHHIGQSAKQHKQPQWLHLEPKIRQGTASVQKAHWVALRRAVYARPA